MQAFGHELNRTHILHSGENGVNRKHNDLVVLYCVYFGKFAKALEVFDFLFAICRNAIIIYDNSRRIRFDDVLYRGVEVSALLIGENICPSRKREQFIFQSNTANGKHRSFAGIINKRTHRLSFCQLRCDFISLCTHFSNQFLCTFFDMENLAKIQYVIISVFKCSASHISTFLSINICSGSFIIFRRAAVYWEEIVIGAQHKVRVLIQYSFEIGSSAIQSFRNKRHGRDRFLIFRENIV